MARRIRILGAVLALTLTLAACGDSGYGGGGGDDSNNPPADTTDSGGGTGGGGY
jgi:hypothetical protein